MSTHQYHEKAKGTPKQKPGKGQKLMRAIHGIVAQGKQSPMPMKRGM